MVERANDREVTCSVRKVFMVINIILGLGMASLGNIINNYSSINNWIMKKKKRIFLYFR